LRVADAMTRDFLTARGEEGLRQVAQRMVERWVGSAIVEPGSPGSATGILTERHVVEVVGAGNDPSQTRVGDHFTPDSTTAAPDWPLERVAEAMDQGGSRHLVVADGDPVGVVTMLDLLRSWSSERWRELTVPIREAMRRDFLEVERDETLSETARRMVERELGAAVVAPPKPKAAPDLVTDREILGAAAAGRDPRTEPVAEHLSELKTFSAPDWSLKQATEAMTTGGFQHVVVVDQNGVAGVISIGDIVRQLLG
jgi:CBS domain-containing protein